MHARLRSNKASAVVLWRGATIIALVGRRASRPALANHTQLALNRPENDAEPGCDLFVGATLGLPHRDRPQVVVFQPAEQSLAFFRHLDDEIRRLLTGFDMLREAFA